MLGGSKSGGTKCDERVSQLQPAATVNMLLLLMSGCLRRLKAAEPWVFVSVSVWALSGHPSILDNEKIQTRQ